MSPRRWLIASACSLLVAAGVAWPSLAPAYGGSGKPHTDGGSGNPPGPPSQLTVDDLAAPIGLDVGDVNFGWHVSDGRRGALQTAYRIIVSSSDDPSGRAQPSTVWDSGRVPSADQSAVPYGGPPLHADSTYRWTVQTWGSSGGAGPLAADASFETGLQDGDWKAQWVRRLTPDPTDTPSSSAVQAGTGQWANEDEYTYVRKQVALDGSPVVRARAYVSADQQYELYVNGALAGKGEAPSYPDSQYYETDDVTALLRPGAANAVGILYGWQGPGKGRPEGSPGVIAQISVLHRDGIRELVTTDGTWRVMAGAWLAGTQRNTQGDPVDYTENINGPAEPIGWDQPGYDDAGWRPATVIGRPPVAPWTHLVSLRTRIAYQPIRAVSITTLPGGAVVADFGEVVAAIPTVMFHHGVAGRRVTMHAGYLLDGGAPSTVSTTRGTQGTDMSYSYVERGGTETFRPFDYMGFRYFQIDNPGEGLAPADVVALARHTAMPDGQTATFSSSNATVDAVYALAAHSALYTSQEQFIDTPTREKGPFLRDGFNESQVDMDAFGDRNLTRKDLLELAQSQARYWPDGRVNAIYPSGEYPYVRDIPDFTEIYPEWVWQYWLHTGDRSLLAEVYPVVVGIAGYVERAVTPSTGLITNLPGGGGPGSAYNGGLVDYPASMRYGYDVGTAARTTVNELGVDVFARTADIAGALGHPAGEIALQRQRQTALTAAINARLRRPDGVYIDGLEPDGRQSRHASQHANAYAVAYGIVPPHREDAVATYVATLGMAMGPQTAQALLEAFRLTGRPQDLVTRVTDPTTDGWAKILAEGATFTWEDWAPSDAQGDSMSHGWGSTVLVEIQQGLLGVTPTGAAFSTFDVSPPLGGLAQASGSVPTPRGMVDVAWARGAGTYSLDLTVPANAVAFVHVAATGLGGVSDGGRPVAGDPGVTPMGLSGGAAALRVGAGTYHLRSAGLPPPDAGAIGADPTGGDPAAAGSAHNGSAHDGSAHDGSAHDGSAQSGSEGSGAGGAGSALGGAPARAGAATGTTGPIGAGRHPARSLATWSVVLAILLILGGSLALVRYQRTRPRTG